MALVSCPNCKKRISSRAAECPHCGFDIQSADDEKLQRLARIQAIKQQQAMMTQSFLALLLFVAGFAMTYLGDTETYPWLPVVGLISAAIGFFWYILIRVWMIWSKRK